MWKLVLLWVAGVLFQTDALAVEHSACNEPGYPFWIDTAPELREIAELRLHGYDHLADRLEQN